VKISDRMTNILGLFLVMTALIIQGWMSIFQLATDDITYAYTFWFDVGLILLVTGGAMLATLNINRIFAIHHRINYVIIMTGLVGLSILLIFSNYLGSLLFPRTLIITFLILDFFWIFLLGLILKRLQTKSNTTSATN